MKKYICCQNSKIDPPLIFTALWERLHNHQNRIVVINCENNHVITDYLITIESLTETEQFIKANYFNPFNNQQLLKKISY